MGYLSGRINYPVATFVEDQFTGDGSTVAFTLSETVSSDAEASVFIQGALQDTDQYSITGKTLTFSSAPADQTAIRVRYSRREVGLYVPDASVGRDQLTTDAKNYSEGVIATALTPSSTTADFTALPSWIRHVTVMMSDLSGSGTSPLGVQIGDATGGLATSGYNSFIGYSDLAGSAPANDTWGFQVWSFNTAANGLLCVLDLYNVTGNLWIARGISAENDTSQTSMICGDVTLSGALDRVRITFENGTDTFDAGTVNIRYDR